MKAAAHEGHKSPAVLLGTALVKVPAAYAIARPARHRAAGTVLLKLRPQRFFLTCMEESPAEGPCRQHNMHQKKSPGGGSALLLCAAMLPFFASASWAGTSSCSTAGSSSGCSSVDQSFSGLSVIIPANNDFNSSGVGTNYLYNPTLADQGGSGWEFNSVGTPGGGSNDNGALIYGSQWYAGTAPGGPDVAGLQQFSGSTQAASISQLVSGFTVGADYDVSFYMAQRDIQTLGVSAGDTIQVLLGGQILGTYTPTTTTWTPVTTGVMQATASTLNLEFVSTSVGALSTPEVDTLFDDVIINDPNPAPEPSTMALAGGVLVLLVLLKKLPRKRANSGSVAGI